MGTVIILSGVNHDAPGLSCECLTAAGLERVDASPAQPDA
jgi:hypothetical protein